MCTVLMFKTLILQTLYALSDVSVTNAPPVRLWSGLR